MRISTYISTIGTIRPTTRATQRHLMALDAAHDRAAMLLGRHPRGF